LISWFGVCVAKLRKPVRLMDVEEIGFIDRDWIELCTDHM